MCIYNPFTPNEQLEMCAQVLCACIILDVCLSLQNKMFGREAQEGEGSYIRQMNVGMHDIVFPWCTVSVMKIILSLVETIYTAN